MNKFTHSACRQNHVTAPSFILIPGNSLIKIYMELDAQTDTFNS